MKLLVYSAKDFEIPFLNFANNNKHKVTYTKDSLDSQTAIQAVGFKAISIFSADDASSLVLEKLSELGVRYITLRSSGYNNVQIKVAKNLGLKVANVPYYSPYAIAEHAVALLQAFNRKILVANKRVHEYNFLQEGLMGFNLHGKTIGIIGTGAIGSIMVKIMHGFGCHILAHDLFPDSDLVELCNVTYKSLDDVCKESDVISLHIPLTYESHGLIDRRKLALMKKNVILVNTARGAIVNTEDLINALDENDIGGYCTDVYDKEKGIFFKDCSKEGIADENLKKLLTYSNVLMTPHQAFMTTGALENISKTTFENIDDWAAKRECKNELGHASMFV